MDQEVDPLGVAEVVVVEPVEELQGVGEDLMTEGEEVPEEVLEEVVLGVGEGQQGVVIQISYGPMDFGGGDHNLARLALR